MNKPVFPISSDLIVSSLIFPPFAIILVFFASLKYLTSWVSYKTGINYLFSFVVALVLVIPFMLFFLVLVLTGNWEEVKSYYNIQKKDLIKTEKRKVSTSEQIKTQKKEKGEKKEGIRNAVILLITGKSFDRILMVRDTYSRKWMLPGGKIEKGETPFQGAVREFKEETSFELPYIKNKFNSYVYHGHTAIFIGHYAGKFPEYDKSKVKNMETDELKFVKISELFTNKYKLKSYVEDSLKEIKKEGCI